MTSLIKLTLPIGLFFSLSFVCAQERVLKLAEGKRYELYFVDVAVRDDPFPTDTVAGKFTIRWDRGLSFLIDDVEIIQDLGKGWVGARGQMVGCWYDYFLYLVEDGVVVDEIRINESCKQVITSQGVYDYTDSTLSKVDRSKKIAVARLEFESLEVGRNFASAGFETRDIYMPGISDRDWYKYGGSIVVKTKRRNIGKLKAKIASVIAEKFPGESFAVSSFSCNNRFCIFNVYCSEKLGTSMRDFTVYRNWSRFDPRILLFGKADIPIKELVAKYAH